MASYVDTKNQIKYVETSVFLYLICKTSLKHGFSSNVQFCMESQKILKKNLPLDMMLLSKLQKKL